MAVATLSCLLAPVSTYLPIKLCYERCRDLPESGVFHDRIFSLRQVGLKALAAMGRPGR